MSVHGETVLEFMGDKPQKQEWAGYGFYIYVPKGALPPGVAASVTVKVVAGGQLKFPEKRQLISALYWVSSSDKFLKEVTVNIEHCAVIKNEEQCSTFKFIVAKCSQEVLPYTFRERDGVFNLLLSHNLTIITCLTPSNTLSTAWRNINTDLHMYIIANKSVHTTVDGKFDYTCSVHTWKR